MKRNKGLKQKKGLKRGKGFKLGSSGELEWEEKEEIAQMLQERFSKPQIKGLSLLQERANLWEELFPGIMENRTFGF